MNFTKKLFLQIIKYKEEIIYMFSKSPNVEHLSAAEKKLYFTNKEKWKPLDNNKQSDYILIEGLLSSYGPNYLYRTGLITKAVQAKFPQLTPIVLYTSLMHLNIRATVIYKSFGIDVFVSTANSLINQFLKFYAKFKAYFAAKQINDGESLLDFHFGGIHLGDLIYDNIISSLKTYKTIDEIKPDMKPFISQAVYEVIIFNRLFKKYKPKFYISTHPCYITYGVLCRLALRYNCRVILTTDIEVIELHKNLDPNVKWTPVFHEFVGNYIKEKLKLVQDENKLIEESKSYLENRIKGKIDQVDIQLAYSSKTEYEENFLRKQLELTENKPIVFIFAHIIADAPHTSHFLLFKDYFVWLKETLKICAEIKDVYWLVKPHPAAKVYSEIGLVEKLVTDLNMTHIKIVPNDFNTNSAIKYAHALLTINGTAGLEFSCFGVPVILAGKPFYSGHGICLEPRSMDEYIKMLNSIKDINKLSTTQIQMALKVLAIFNGYSISNNKVLTSDLLMKVWGYKDRDLEFVFNQMAKNLEEIDPKTEPQYLRAIEIVNQ